jgi:hypothetical protein
MKKVHKGIVFFVVGLLEVSIFLIGLIAIPFPQFLAIALMDTLNEEMQAEFDEQMADPSFRDQFLNQFLETMQSSFGNPNQNEMEYRNDENYFEFITQEDSVELFEIPNRGMSAMQIPESRTDIIVPVTEYHAGCMDTEPGKITFLEGEFPHVLPLCWDQADMDLWYLTFEVYGGYVPLDLGSYMMVSQGKEGKMFCVDIVWTEDDIYPECCCHSSWTATFVLIEDVCLDSNQYPTYEGHPYFSVCKPPFQDTIPGKKVFVEIYLQWSGCLDVLQQFKLIPVRDKSQFSCL